MCRRVIVLLFYVAVMWSLMSWMLHKNLMSQMEMPRDAEEQIVNLPVTHFRKNGMLRPLLKSDQSGPISISRNPSAKNEEKAPCLVVYHIPKTGGLTLGQHLESLADKLDWHTMTWYEKVCRAYGNSRPPQIRSYNESVIHIGHLTPHFEEVTHTQACYKMTLLREPVDRVISAFNFHLHQQYDWGPCLEKRCRLWHEYHNDVVRRFAARGSAWHSFSLESYLGDQEDKQDEMESSLLADAQRSLESLDFVCFLDNIRGCIEQVSRVLFQVTNGKGGPNKVLSFEDTVVNKNKRRGRVSTTMKQHIAKANALDMQLYEWALERFGGQHKQEPQ